jgi:hypothetical protein
MGRGDIKSSNESHHVWYVCAYYSSYSTLRCAPRRVAWGYLEVDGASTPQRITIPIVENCAYIEAHVEAHIEQQCMYRGVFSFLSGSWRAGQQSMHASVCMYVCM